MNSETYYELLGISETATHAEVRKAYIKMIRQYTNETHPEMFQSITKAYKTLENPETRKQYDLSIKGGGKYQESINLINEYLEEEEYHEALKLIHELLHEHPESPSVLNLQAQCYYFLDNYLEAERILKHLLLDDPQNELYLSQLASLYFSLEDYSNAINFYKRLTELSPEENNYFLRLSNCYLNLDNVEEACRILENKLSSKGETIYDFPLLSELYFLTVVKDDQYYHKKVIARIVSLPKNSEERTTLLNLLIDLAVNINTEHHLFKELIYLIDDINDHQDPAVTSWVEEATEKLEPDMVYYGEEGSFVEQQNNHSSSSNLEEINSHSDNEVSEVGRGSIFWAIVFGIVASFFLSPIGGIIVGIIYYYFGQKIKEVLSCLGCLVFIIIVLGIFFNGCSL